MLGINKKIPLIFLFCCSLMLSAQTKEELGQEKIKLEKEIIYTEGLLKKTKKNKKKSLNYLRVLDSQINKKEKLLNTVSLEIKLLKKQINKISTTITNTEESILNEEEKLEDLKAEYAKMIYAAFKQKGSRNDLMFVVSSKDFNQAYKRILYLKQYSKFRKNQAEKIVLIQEQLIKKKEQLANQKDRFIEESAVKRILIDSKKEEIKSINNTKKKKRILIKKLSQSENKFRNKLEEKQKKAKQLEDRIKKIIEEEIKKSRLQQNTKGANNDYVLTPEAQALSAGFISNKGRLPWPLEKGVIVSMYGKQKHPVFSEVETFNNGIDIATNKNTEIRAVFEGEVSRIFFIKGEGKAVLINHGEYFSVYSGLKEVIVKRGQKINSKESIGVIMTNEEEDKTELHFEIWRGYEKQNPSIWLYTVY